MALRSTGRFQLRRPKFTSSERRLVKKYLLKKAPNSSILQKIAYNQKPDKYISLIKSASDKIIKSIATAALNARHNSQIQIPTDLKRYFKRNQHILSPLIQKQRSSSSRRRILLTKRANQRGGGFPLIPLLLSIAIPAIGNAIGAITKK